MKHLLHAAAIAAFAVASAPIASAQLLDLSQMKGLSKVPPIESQILSFSGNTAQLTVDLSQSRLVHIDVDDPATIYDISLESVEPIGLTLEAYKLELNGANQVTKKTVLLSDSSFGLTDRVATFGPTLLGSGRIYLGLAAVNAVKATLRIKRTPKANVITAASKSSKTPTKVSNDTTGPADGTLRCLRPAAFDTAGADDFLLLTDPQSSVWLYHYTNTAKRLAGQSGTGSLEIRGVRNNGAHNVCVQVKKSKAVAQTAWRLIAKPTPASVFAAEPDAATPITTLATLKVDTPLRAPLDKDDTDRYRIEGEGVFDLAYRTNAKTRVCLYQGRSGGNNIQECYTGSQTKIGPFRKNADTLITIEQRGRKQGLYELTLTASRAEEETTVFEPNSTGKWQREYTGAARVSGRLSKGGDRDSFTLNPGDDAQMWRFVVLGEGVRQVQFSTVSGEIADIRRGQRNGRRLTTPDLYLQPGPLQISITGSPGPYKVIAKPLGAPPAWSELEPNYSLPRRIAFKEEIRGTLDTGDTDRFSFFLHRDADILFKMTTPAGARYRGDLSAPNLTRETINGGSWVKRVRVPAGEHVFTLSPSKTSPAEYTLSIDYADPFTATGETATIALARPLPPVQAFSVFEQVITADITVTNSGSAALKGQLRTWAERPGVIAQPAALNVPAGGSSTVSVQLVLPPDLYDGPLRLAFGALGAAGNAQASHFVDLNVDAKAPATGAREALPAPPSLIGGINVARTALGARWISVDGVKIDEKGDYARGNPYGASSLYKIIDGIIEQGQPPVGHEGYLSSNTDKTLAPVLQLPGNAAIPIAGIGIDTRMHKPIGIRAFAVDVSLDGNTWQELLSGRHETWGKPAYYAAKNGVKSAKFIRLRALDKRGAARSSLALNAFEVIAQPGASGITDLNIGDKNLGALTSNLMGMRANRDLFLDPSEQSATRLYTEKKNPTQINAAITFKNMLPADVAAVELVYGTTDKNSNFPLPTEAIVFASPKGPTGPFREITRAALPAAPQKGETLRIDFPEFITAKAIKVEFAHNGAGSLRGPANIRVLERPESDDYRSVLGVWGEWAMRRSAAKPMALAADDAAQSTLTLVPDGAEITQTVEFGKDTDTWRIAAPDSANTVRVSLAGSPGFDPSVSARDASGAALKPIEILRSDFLKTVTYVYAATPGSYVDVSVSEEKRSTVFLIDQSPSVAPFIPKIRRAIVDFAADMEQGRDAVQFKIFGGQWPKEGWYTDPIPLRQALARYPGGGNSAAEAALVDAAEKLKEEDGSRAIVIITDADANVSGDLMPALEAARARVFVIKISSGAMWQDPTVSQPTSMLWAGQTGGEVSPVLQSEDISIAYARASARLLGPKPYTISAELDTRVIDPGALEVAALTADNRSKSLDNLHIIFDASGSMLKRLEGTRRIKIAKGALQGLFFEDRLDSSQTKIGLRVFGGPPGSCESKLVEPLSTNNLVTLAKAVNAINPQNNAKTAIGASLLAAKDDMANIEGTSSILLITDGEETCGGDPLSAIESLKAAGIKTRIDVVSFALEPEIDRRTFKSWATAGGGIYADAQSSADLQAAIATAVQARFDILKEGAVVASGLSGGPLIALAPGQYTLRRDGGSDIQTFAIAQNKTTKVTLE